MDFWVTAITHTVNAKKCMHACMRAPTFIKTPCCLEKYRTSPKSWMYCFKRVFRNTPQIFLKLLNIDKSQLITVQCCIWFVNHVSTEGLYLIKKIGQYRNLMVTLYLLNVICIFHVFHVRIWIHFLSISPSFIQFLIQIVLSISVYKSNSRNCHWQ